VLCYQDIKNSIKCSLILVTIS